MKRETLASLAVPVPAEGEHRFCKTPDCPVVYYPEGGGEWLGIARVGVRVGQKETAADRPVCYCFGFSAADVRDDPTVADQIRARCRAGEDRCVRTNPQGACCLGNVQAVVKELAK